MGFVELLGSLSVKVPEIISTAVKVPYHWWFLGFGIVVAKGRSTAGSPGGSLATAFRA
jgi:hypothetical protein